MEIFLSWSGDLSMRIAQQFHEWLPVVLQAVRPFFSPETEKGTRWRNEISKRLDDSLAGLIFLSPDNLQSPWLAFEAGALGKSVEESRIWTVLINLAPGDIGDPLAQFQHTGLSKAELQKLVSSINGHLETPLEDKTLGTSFETTWPLLSNALETTLKEHPAPKEEDLRSQREIMLEVLSIVRSLGRSRDVHAGELVIRAIQESAGELYLADEGKTQAALRSLRKHIIDTQEQTR